MSSPNLEEADANIDVSNNYIDVKRAFGRLMPLGEGKDEHCKAGWRCPRPLQALPRRRLQRDREFDLHSDALGKSGASGATKGPGQSLKSACETKNRPKAVFVKAEGC